MHFSIDGMMDRSVVEYNHGRTFIALQGDLLEELDDSAAFDRRARDMVSQGVLAPKSSAPSTERRQWKRGSTQ
jgi:hypothetical protein